MQHGRMVMQDLLFIPHCCLFVTMVLFSIWCLSTGKGPLCAINRSSTFVLLSIQIHLCDLVRSLYVELTFKKQKKSQGLIWKVLSVGIPCLLMAISYGGFFWVQRSMSWVAYGFLVSHMPSVECHENCETTENYQLNVARHAFSCSMRFGPIWFAWCSRMRIMPSRIKFLDAHVLSDVRFSNMGTEWGGYHLHLLLLESLLNPLAPLYVLLLCLPLFSWVTLYSHRCLWKGLVWWDVAILYTQCLLFFWCHYSNDVPSRHNVAKGFTSFGAAHLRLCSAWLVTFLQLLLSLLSYDEAVVYIHLHFFATDNGLKWNFPSNRK